MQQNKPADPTHAVTFDLSRGEVHLDLPSGEDRRGSLVVPGDALAALAEVAGASALAAFGRSLGARLGERVEARLGGDVKGASTESVIAAIAGEVAIAGLGALALERWGRALVLLIEGGSLPSGGAADALRAAAIEGALARATGRALSATALARDGATLRVLVASSGTVERARALLREGLTWGDVIVRLHGASRAGSEEASA